MNQIKFRQRLQNDKWHYWGFFDGVFVNPVTSEGVEEAKEHSQEFTGLLDKNGNDIYEKDILKHPYDGNLPHYEYTVEKSNGSYWMVRKKDGITVVDLGEPFLLDENEAKNNIVVGNIYDNPEIVSKSEHPEYGKGCEECGGYEYNHTSGCVRVE